MGAVSEKNLEQAEQMSFAARKKPEEAPKERTPLERIGVAAGRPVRAEEYYWPRGAPTPEELQAQFDREAEALEQLERMGRFAVTLREKIIYYLNVMYALLEGRKEMLDRPVTWAEFRRLVARTVAEYSRGRAHHD